MTAYAVVAPRRAAPGVSCRCSSVGTIRTVAYGTSLHCGMRRCLLFVLSHLFYFIYSTPLTLSTDDVWLTRRVANDASDGAANNTTQMKTAQMKSSGQKKTEEEKNKKDTIRLICRILGSFHNSSDRIARVSHCISVCRVPLCLWNDQCRIPSVEQCESTDECG